MRRNALRLSVQNRVLSTGAIQEGITLSRIASMAQGKACVRGFGTSDNEQSLLRQRFDTFVVFP
jgi:hypothetical protein